MKCFKDENYPLKSLKHSPWKWQICVHIRIAVCGTVAEETERLIGAYSGVLWLAHCRDEISSLLKIKQNRERFSFSKSKKHLIHWFWDLKDMCIQSCSPRSTF